MFKPRQPQLLFALQSCSYTLLLHKMHAASPLDALSISFFSTTTTTSLLPATYLLQHRELHRSSNMMTSADH